MAKKDGLLAERIEEAIRKNESLESLTTDNVRRDVARTRITEQKGKTAKLIKVSNQKTKTTAVSARTSGKRPSITKSAKPSSTPAKPSRKIVKVTKNSKTTKASSVGKQNRPTGGSSTSTARKLNVVGFRGRASSSKR